MKKVVIMFELEAWELMEILAGGFSGEIYTIIMEDGRWSETTERLKRCQDVVLITKGHGCTCGNDEYGKHLRYFTYHHNSNGADEVWQCWDCGFQWRKVRRYIDAHPEQLMTQPTILNEEDGFKRIFPME